jgi:nicotinate-nucleotide--dimethylbenzimidazole phosphoribosyltransferase
VGNAQETVTETLKRIGPVAVQGTDHPVRQTALPLHGLGQLGRLVARLRAIRGADQPARTPLRKLLIIAAGDHGVGKHGISHYPQASTRHLLADVLAGRAAIAHLAPRRQVRAVAVDFGVVGEVTGEGTGWAEFDSQRIAEGTADISLGPAMDRDTALASIAAGIRCFERWSSGWDVDLLGLGDLGIGSSISACAIAAALTDRPVDELTGRGAQPGRTTRTSLVAAAVERVSPPDPHDAVALLSEYGGLELGALAGACLSAAADRVPVLLDGAVSTAAAAIAGALSPAARDYLIASHESALPAHGALLQHLGLEPLLQLQLDFGEGVGSVLAMDLVEAAVELGGT